MKVLATRKLQSLRAASKRIETNYYSESRKYIYSAWGTAATWLLQRNLGIVLVC